MPYKNKDINRKYQREYQRKWSKTKKGKRSLKKKYDKEYIIFKNAMTRLKSNGCSICGYKKCERSLHFHHVSKNKTFPLMMGCFHRSNEQIIKELNKCILICANCHGEITQKERMVK